MKGRKTKKTRKQKQNKTNTHTHEELKIKTLKKQKNAAFNQTMQGNANSQGNHLFKRQTNRSMH